MGKSIFYRIDASVISIALFVIMMLLVALGNKMRNWIGTTNEGETTGGVNALLGALFGLWGFMLAFSFGQSGTRFENVRSMIVDEANIMRSCILRADFFPEDVRDAYRTDFRSYLEERISYYDNITNETRLSEIKANMAKTEASLWARTVEQATHRDMAFVAANMGASLTSLYEMTIKREALLNSGIPAPIGYMLCILGLAICFAGGFTTPVIRRKEWTIVFFFTLLAALIMYITIDLSRPMRGLIKPDTGEQTIVDLRRMF